MLRRSGRGQQPVERKARPPPWPRPLQGIGARPPRPAARASCRREGRSSFPAGRCPRRSLGASRWCSRRAAGRQAWVHSTPRPAARARPRLRRRVRGNDAGTKGTERSTAQGLRSVPLHERSRGGRRGVDAQRFCPPLPKPTIRAATTASSGAPTGDTATLRMRAGRSISSTHPSTTSGRSPSPRPRRQPPSARGNGRRGAALPQLAHRQPSEGRPEP